MTTQINYPNCIINISDNSGNYTILKNDSITLGGLKIYTNSSSLGANIMEVTSTNINFSNLLSGITQYREYGYSTIYKNINASGNINQGTYNNDSIKFNNNQSGLNISTTVMGTTLNTTNAYNIKSSNDISITATNINLSTTNSINCYNFKFNLNYNSIINASLISSPLIRSFTNGRADLNAPRIIFMNSAWASYGSEGIRTYFNYAPLTIIGDITIKGPTNFVISPEIPEPKNLTHIASKNYVDLILSNSSTWSGINTFSNTNYFTTIDSNAAILNIGTTSATRTNIGRTNIVTNINGSLLINGTAALTNQVLTTTGWLDTWTATSNLSMAGYYIIPSTPPNETNYIGSSMIGTVSAINITTSVLSWGSIRAPTGITPSTLPIGNYILLLSCRVVATTTNGTLTYLIVGAGTTTAMEYGSITITGGSINTNANGRPFVEPNLKLFVPITSAGQAVNFYITGSASVAINVQALNSTNTRLIKLY